MKYCLKKDLPFTKAGAEVFVNDSAIWIEVKGEPYCRNLQQYREPIEEELQRLISEGWIEEVKPREWTVQVVNGNLSHSLCGGNDIIKVREVIE